jgi:hypothetical protein
MKLNSFKGLLLVVVILCFSMARFWNTKVYTFPMPQTRTGFGTRQNELRIELGNLVSTHVHKGERAAVMEWQFSVDNIKKEPKLEEMLSSFALRPGSLKTLKLSSPGVPKTTTIVFFGKNPGWLSRRTFTADIFTCPPNSHEGRQHRP